ncbi:GNAT family N-acetyltransferase [Peribacillus sp. NPDC101480]|uniref:GNAT family N-acetyltransferase n=1 Tax=Peribacillus sp. NPDC101480 TaxID=3390620 RepID=UPI003D047EB6
MTTIREIIGGISVEQKKEILELVSNNFEDVSAFVIQRNSPFYEYVRVLEITRTEMYLDKLKTAEPEKTYLIVAEDSGKIIGYILFNRDSTCFDDASICSTVVSEKYRNLGIFTKMMDLLKVKTKCITLSCFIDKVNFYQKFDFRVDGTFETQVAMTYGTYGGKGDFKAAIDTDVVGSSKPCLDEIRKLQKSLGESFQQEYIKVMLESDKEKSKVKEFVEDNSRIN